MHWFQDVFTAAQDFLDGLIDNYYSATPALRSGGLKFTLRTANPDETGSKNGFRIVELETPGRRVDRLRPRSIADDRYTDSQGLTSRSTTQRGSSKSNLMASPRSVSILLRCSNAAGSISRGEAFRSTQTRPSRSTNSFPHPKSSHSSETSTAHSISSPPHHRRGNTGR